MKVLVVTNMLAGANPSHPNQGVFVSEQVDALRSLPDMDVDVVVVKGFQSNLAYLWSAVEVIKKARRKKYRVVHYHFGLTAWCAPVVWILTRSKIVITLHGSDVFGTPILRLITRFAVRFADVCIAVSDEILREVVPWSKHCVTIPCGVNDSLFRQPEYQGVQREFKTVVFPSASSRPEKDYPLFAATISHLRAVSDYTIVERQMEGLNREEVRDLLQGADALVMTSKREGSPQAIKEAMACALPVVSVDVGDVAHLLRDVEACRVVEERDPKLIASALQEVLALNQRSGGPSRLRSLGYLSTDVARRVQMTYLES